MTMLTYLQREQCQPRPWLIYQCIPAPVHWWSVRIDVAVSDRGRVVRRRNLTATPERWALRGAKYHGPATICRPLWQHEQAGCFRRPEWGTLWFLNGTGVPAPASRGSVWGRVRGNYTEPAVTAFPIGRTIRWSWPAVAGTETRVVVSKGDNCVAQRLIAVSGTSTAQQAPAPLFGNSQPPQNQPAPLFGSTQQQQQQPQQQQQGGSLFGGTQSNNMAFGLGNSTASLAQAQAVQMASCESIKGTTRFNDLSPDIQQQITQLDEIIQGRINNAHKTRESIPQHIDQVGTIAPDVAYVENFLSTVELGLDNDSANIASLKALVKKDAEEAYLSFRAIENQALPPQFRYGNTSNLSTSTSKPGPSSSLDDDDPTKPVDLVGYFNRRTQDLGNTLDLYQRQIREIEAHLRTMEAGTVEKAQQLTGSRSRPQDQRRELVGALQAIEGAILDSAKKVGKVRDEVTKHTMGSVGAGLL